MKNSVNAVGGRTGVWSLVREISSPRALSFRLCATVFASVVAAPAAANDDPAATTCADVSVTSCVVGDTVLYAPAFFTQYNPVTALDMVRRVPGFSIDAGDNVRGFGGAAGNVLIDGQRPSTKSADIFQTLSRISASDVERIELIRGGTGGLDVGGQAVVVNVVLKSGAAAGASAPWEFTLLKRRPNGWLRPVAEISYNGRAGRTKYTIGANAHGIALRFGGDEEITRFFDDDELRRRDGVFKAQGGGVNLKLERALANGDTARFNFEGGIVRFREDFTETRFLATGGPDVALFTFPLENIEFEIGADYEHAITDNFGVKLIALYGLEFEDFESGFEFLPASGDPDKSLFISDQTEGETIGRTEFDWKGWSKHTIQFGGEIARNFIDSEADLLVDDGMGGLTAVAIDGANTRVSELRGEAFVNDSWALASKLKLDIGFALELSRIAQSGDNANSRFFSYPKPSVTLTYTPAEKTQWRFSAERKVNQLSFGQFVSSVNFDDEDVDFGNPELQPQRTWAFDVAYERRFGKIGVVEVIGFFNYIQDVEDLLPIGGVVEVPGNIGDGKIYGGTLKLTAPLDWLGLKNARVESSFTQRDSVVTDPVTGLDRTISFRPDRFYEVEFRQDFSRAKISWGWDVSDATNEFGFGLDEVSRFFATTEFNAFVETTAIKGVKVRFEVRDISNVENGRDRTIFDGSRALGLPLFREIRGNKNGGAYRLTFSGAL
ncbi:MAG: TonB-dependent receptor plug domain-containing protein [Parvularculaceae bacterium]